MCVCAGIYVYHVCMHIINVGVKNFVLVLLRLFCSEEVLDGDFSLAEHEVHYASGTGIARFPSDGLLVAKDLHDQGKEIHAAIAPIFWSIHTCT